MNSVGHGEPASIYGRYPFLKLDGGNVPSSEDTQSSSILTSADYEDLVTTPSTHLIRDYDVLLSHLQSLLKELESTDAKSEIYQELLKRIACKEEEICGLKRIIADPKRLKDSFDGLIRPMLRGLGDVFFLDDVKFIADTARVMLEYNAVVMWFGRVFREEQKMRMFDAEKWRQAFTSLEQQLAAADAALAIASEKLKQAQKEIEGLEQENQNLQESNKQLIAMNHTLQQTIEEHRTKLRSVQQQLTESLAEINSLKKEVEEANQQNQAKDARIYRLEQQIIGLQCALAASVDESKNDQAAIAKLKQKLEMVEGEYTQIMLELKVQNAPENKDHQGMILRLEECNRYLSTFREELDFLQKSEERIQEREVELRSIEKLVDTIYTGLFE